MTARARYQVTAALPAARLRRHSPAVTAVTEGRPLACTVTGNAPHPPAAAEVTP